MCSGKRSCAKTFPRLKTTFENIPFRGNETLDAFIRCFREIPQKPRCETEEGMLRFHVIMTDIMTNDMRRQREYCG